MAEPGGPPSQRFTWQGAYVQGVGGAAPQAGRRAAPLQAGQPQRARGSCYSQASLLSKLDRAMAKACSAHNG